MKELGKQKFVEALETQDLREEIKAIRRAGRLKFGMVHTLADPYWFDCFKILGSRIEKYEGKTIGEIAHEREIDPLDAVLDILVHDPGAEWVQFLDRRGTDISVAVMLSHRVAMPSTDVAAASLEPKEGAVTDQQRGYVDLPPIAFGLYPHYIHSYVYERGSLTLEEAIYKATYRVAQTIGIEDRGILRPGA